MYKAIWGIRIATFLGLFTAHQYCQLTIFWEIFHKATKFLSCPECNCVEDDEERTIKAQIEMDCQLEKKWTGKLTPITLASKHERVNFSFG